MNVEVKNGKYPSLNQTVMRVFASRRCVRNLVVLLELGQDLMRPLELTDHELRVTSPRCNCYCNAFGFSFWDLSMFEKPEGREVICHASAWDFYDTKVL